MDRTLGTLKTRIYTEIDNALNRGNVDPSTWEMIGEVVDVLKDMAEIDSYEHGHSNDSRRIVYDNGNRMYSYNDGRSYHSGKDQMISELNRMMNEASTERERTIIYDCIGQLKMS